MRFGHLPTLLLLLPLFGCDGSTTEAAPPGGPPTSGTAGAPSAGLGGGVSGAFFATPGSRDVWLPGVHVRLRRMPDGPFVAATETNLDGYFELPRVPDGTYRLFAGRSGFKPFKSPPDIVISGSSLRLPDRKLVPNEPVVWGNVSTLDDSPLHYVIPSFGVESHTEVSLSGVFKVKKGDLDGLVSRGGDYVIAGAPAGPAQLTARLGSASVSTGVLVGGTTEANLVLPNQAPRILSLAAQLNGVAVKKASPGDGLEVTAETFDTDGDALTISWQSPTKGATVTPLSDESVAWELPFGETWSDLYAVVTDGSAYDLRRMHLRVVDEEAVFGGRVQGPGGNPMPGAEVVVNGVATATDGQGAFSLEVPQAGRYVLTISRFGFMQLSTITYGEVRSHVYTLPAAKVFPGLDSSQGAVLEEQGFELHIPPNALRFEGGQNYNGPFAVALSAIDPTRADGGFPGDQAGIDEVGALKRLDTFGAVGVEIRSPGGDELNLRPGSSAFLRVPALPGAPSAIPLWTYDEVAGVWDKEPGAATLVAGAYEFQIDHFSIINMDLEYGDAACLRLFIDERLECQLPLELRVTVEGKQKTQIIEDLVTILVRLPASTEVLVEVLNDAGDPISALTETFDSGAAEAIGSDLSPEYPYYDCTNSQELLLPDGDDYLNYISNGEADSWAYYEALGIDDPEGDPLTLEEWKTDRGYDSSASTTTAYLNRGDLCFGRRMEMFQVGDESFFFVTNYADVDDAVDQNLPIATVAMEYSRHPDAPTGDRYTKFLVFDGSGALTNQADLDGLGARYVPGLCLVCHKGEDYSESGDASGIANLGARFIAFDLESFEYSTDAGWTRSAQESDFKLMNQVILEDTNVTDAVRELIEGWYGGSSLPDASQDDTWTPSGWLDSSLEEEAYQVTFKTSCRACHTTRSADTAFTSFDALEANGLVEDFVCDYGIMPHARVTNLNFWLDADRLEAFQNAGLLSAECGD